MFRTAAASWLLLLAACGQPDVVPLHARAEFAGSVTWRTADSTTTPRVDLAFDRARGSLQVTSRGDVARTIARAPDRSLVVFADGVPVSGTAADEALLASIERIVHAPADTPVVALPDGYRLELRPQPIELRLTPLQSHTVR